MVVEAVVFFFFKQKTAYEMRISDWSSDVCSSDLRMRVLCGQGVAPALATPSFFRDKGLDLVPGIGLLPATVPGAFGAWLTMLRDYGTWELEEIGRAHV